MPLSDGHVNCAHVLIVEVQLVAGLVLCLSSGVDRVAAQIARVDARV